MSDKELIAEAGKHVPYAAIMDDAKRCMHCADEWPCVTRRLADALEARQPSEDASGAISAVLNRLDELNNGGISYEVYSELHDLVSAIPYAVPDAATEAHDPKNLSIMNGWLVECVGEHTCGTGPDGYYGAHEPGCGYEPLVNLSELPGYPDEEKWGVALGDMTERAQKAEAERDAALAAVERVRALEAFSLTDSYLAWTVVDHGDLLAALDGAPEPEVKP